MGKVRKTVIPASKKQFNNKYCSFHGDLITHKCVLINPDPFDIHVLNSFSNNVGDKIVQVPKCCNVPELQIGIDSRYTSKILTGYHFDLRNKVHFNILDTVHGVSCTLIDENTVFVKPGTISGGYPQYRMEPISIRTSSTSKSHCPNVLIKSVLLNYLHRTVNPVSDNTQAGK
jgi:hypothetical protein